MAYLTDFTKKSAFTLQKPLDGSFCVVKQDLANQPTSLQHIELNSTQVAACYYDATNNVFVAVIGTRYSDHCIEWNTPSTIYAGNIDRPIIKRIDDAKFVVSYVQSTDFDGYVVACTVSGTTVTVGTPVEFKDATTTRNLGLVYTATDKFTIYYGNGSTSYCAKVCTLSGTVITLGAETVIAAFDPTVVDTNQDMISRFIDDKLIAIYRESSTLMRVVVLSISGTTITVNTPATTSTVECIQLAVVVTSSTTFQAFHTRVSGNFTYAIAGTISGTSISLGSETPIEQTNASNRKCSFIAINSTTVASVIHASSIPVKVGFSVQIGTAMSYSVTLNISTYYNITNAITSTNLSISFRNNSLFFGYQSTSNLFIASALVISGTLIAYPMFKRLYTVPANSQLEISSVHMYNQAIFTYGTAYQKGRITLENTNPNYTIITSSLGIVPSGAAVGDMVIVNKNNCPIVLTAGQSLYGSISNSYYDLVNSIYLAGLLREV